MAATESKMKRRRAARHREPPQRPSFAIFDARDDSVIQHRVAGNYVVRRFKVGARRVLSPTQRQQINSRSLTPLARVIVGGRRPLRLGRATPAPVHSLIER